MLVLVALYVLHRLPIVRDHYFSLHMKWEGDLTLLDQIIDQLQEEEVQIKNRSITRQPKTGSCHVTLVVRTRQEKTVAHLVSRLQTDTRFDEVGWH
jgi:uncharacterized membrane protein YhiD involved in acid resistance